MKTICMSSLKDRDLSFYLAMEEFVAKHLDDEIFFTWRVSPTVIFGRNQLVENEVNLEYCHEHGIKIFQRKSGGGCVYADGGNVMISYISRRGDVAEVFDRYLASLTSALCKLGLEAEKTGRNDVLVDGRKVSGNAFHQLPDRSIVHGTLLHSVDMDALEASILPPVEKLHRHGVASVRSRVVNMNEYASVCPELESPESLELYMIKCFSDGELTLTEHQIREIEKIQTTYIKY